jgi:hypothetical protein
MYLTQFGFKSTKLYCLLQMTKRKKENYLKNDKSYNDLSSIRVKYGI